MKLTKAERCANLRFRKPALANMGYFDITEGLQEIQDECDRIHWWIDNDQDLLVNALNGEEEAFNFRFAFSDLEADCTRMQENLMQLGWKFSNYEDEYDDDDEAKGIELAFNDMTVALIGNRYNLVGFDDYEMDYFSLTGFDKRNAETTAAKRVMRMTKKEMLENIGGCMGIVLAYMDLQYKFDRLSATMDILQDKNQTMIDTIKDIEKAYAEWAKYTEFYHGYEICHNQEAKEHFEKLLEELPQEVWLN